MSKPRAPHRAWCSFATLFGRQVGYIATPEHNHGVPGVLKNTIDRLSRLPGNSVLNGKVVALMGAVPGMTGTARGQSQLRQAFGFTNTCAPAAGGPRRTCAREV